MSEAHNYFSMNEAEKQALDLPDGRVQILKEKWRLEREAAWKAVKEEEDEEEEEPDEQVDIVYAKTKCGRVIGLEIDGSQCMCGICDGDEDGDDDEDEEETE
jgi:hypothetical protein